MSAIHGFVFGLNENDEAKEQAKREHGEAKRERQRASVLRLAKRIRALPKQRAGFATADERGDAHGQGSNQKRERAGGVSVHQSRRQQGGGVGERLRGKGVKPESDPGDQPDECRAAMCPRE